MARRSPMNERYQKNTAPSGKTRRSAASAKPKRDVAVSGSAKKPAKKPAGRQPVMMNPPTEEFRRWRRIWWYLLLGSVVFTFGSLAVRSWVARPGTPSASTWAMVANVLLAVGYLGIFSALYLDWTKLRRLRKEWLDEQKGGGSSKAKKAEKTETSNDDSAGDSSATDKS